MVFSVAVIILFQKKWEKQKKICNIYGSIFPQFFCKTDLDLVISEFLSWTLHYKKKNLEKIIKCLRHVFFNV